MLKFLLQPYLLACYCFTKAIEEKSENREKNINLFVAHIFTTPIVFFIYGLYLSFIGLFTNKINGTIIVWGGGVVIFLLFGYWFDGWAKKIIDKWKIFTKWEILQKWQRGLYIIFGTIIFWGILALSFYLAVTFFGGYGLRS